MPTMPTPSGPPDPVAVALGELDKAAKIVARVEWKRSRDKDRVLHHLAVAITCLDRGLDGLAADPPQLCRRCAGVIEYDKESFWLRGLRPPRHCERCRAARRQERERAGVPASASVPPED